jgi:hypothetical protein
MTSGQFYEGKIFLIDHPGWLVMLFSTKNTSFRGTVLINVIFIFSVRDRIMINSIDLVALYHVTFFIQTFFIRNKVYTNFLYTGQILYGDKIYTRTKFIWGQSVYGTKFIR